MTPQQVALIQESWRKVLPISDATEETELAWIAAYGRITALMQGKQALLA